MDTNTFQISSDESQQRYTLEEAKEILDKAKQESSAKNDRRKAYFISILFPPMGVIYFIKYIFFGSRSAENVRAGVISLLLTIASLGVTAYSILTLINQAGTVIPAGDLKMLQDLANPKTQQEILQLYK